MLSFVIIRSSDRGESASIAGAYLRGKDGLAVESSIDRAEKLITCRKRGVDASALCLTLDAGDAGVLRLETCLLPDRDRPYLLNLELARHRIMVFLTNLESWGLSDLREDEEPMLTFQQARELFTRALVAPPGPQGGYTLEQDELAHEALVLGIRASEALALAAADRGIDARLNPTDEIPEAARKRGLGRVPNFGCAVPGGAFSEQQKSAVAQAFDFLACPMRWSSLEPSEGRYLFTGSDRWIQWAVKNARVPVVGGPVIDFSCKEAVPGWLTVWEHDYSTLREFAYEHVKRVVTRYRRTVSRWTACSGVSTNALFKLRSKQMLELTRIAVLTTRKLHPQSKILVEISDPFGDVAALHDRGLPPRLYAELVREAGIHIDGFAVTAQVGCSRCGRASRDLLQLSEMLDDLIHFDLPVHVTAAGAPSAPAEDPTGGYPPGHWRAPWTDESQAEWLHAFYAIASSKPHVASITWQALSDDSDPQHMPHGGLLTAAGDAKPALARARDFADAFRERRSPLELSGSESAA